MHKMEKTSKIITIIGLCFEGLAAVMCTLSVLFFSYLDRLPGYKEALLDMSADDLEAFNYIMRLSYILLIIFAVIFMIMFIINLTFFTKLIKGLYTEEQAKKIYLYQAIWGGISLTINSVTGILYLVSGIQGYNGRVDKIKTREGI